MGLANALVATGEIELMSMTSLPLLNPSATPSLPNSTASTSGVSGTMRMMTSAASATALALSRALPPLITSSCEAGFTPIEEERVAGINQMAGHRPPHHAEADKADVHVMLLIQPSPSDVPAFGLYSQPTQPS